MIKKNLISVCIATYKREYLLEKLLISLENQSLPEFISLEIIIVDNDSLRSAEKIYKRFGDSEKVRFKYYIQPVKNISLTRNLCIQNASGNLICFIDDDETASELWVSTLYNSLYKFNADGVFGYVETVFDKKIPSYFQHRDFYFSPLKNTGSVSGFYFTTNVMVKTDIIKNEEIPFNPAYGLTGGEDAHLFERLVRKGAKFIDCREAVTFEFVPSERATYKYLFNRALRGGQSFARRKLEFNDQISSRIFVLIKAIAMTLYSSLIYTLSFRSKYNKIKSLLSIGESVGKIRSVFGLHKQLY